MMEGQVFDLLVEATSEYEPASNLENGFECGLPAQNCTTGHFGQISVLAGTKVNIKISFQDTKTNEPIKLSRFSFSLHDFDRSADNMTNEVAYISGFAGVTVDKKTEIDVGSEDGLTKLAGRSPGTECDDPENPLRLATKQCADVAVDQKKRSAVFIFEKTSSILMTLEVTCNKCSPGSGRTFLFAGNTNLVTCQGMSYGDAPKATSLLFR